MHLNLTDAASRWAAVYQQTRRWLAAGCFEALVGAEVSAVDGSLIRAEVERLARTVQTVTGDPLKVAYVDQDSTGPRAADAAARHGIAVEVVKLPQAKRGSFLLSRRWVVERSFVGATRFRRLVKDYERYTETLAGLHVVVFACLMMKQAAERAAGS